MLASSFLPAESLGITEPERDVLIAFWRKAAAGEIPEERFDMGCVGAPECGNSGCIIGWCKTIDLDAARGLYRRFTSIAFAGHPFARLFRSYAPHRTPSAAAEAVYRYLTTGAM